ncbi:MAG: ATP-binding protein, partial [Bacteroidota bacterium]
RTCLGRDVSPYLRSSLEKTENRTVCIVRCTPCNRPVFLRQPGFNEEFYIRVGPGSTALDVSEALKYVADRFPLN